MSDIKKERSVWQERAAKLFCFCVYASAAVLGIKYVFPVIAPFVFAYLISAAVAFLAKRLSRISRLPYGLCAAAALTVLILILGATVFYVCGRLMTELGKAIGMFNTKGLSFFSPIFGVLEELPLLSQLAGVSEEYVMGELPPIISRVLSAVMKYVGEFMGKVLKSTPSAVLSGIVTVISCYYMSIYHRELNDFLTSLLTARQRALIIKAKGGALKTLVKFFKAYLKLFALTYFETFAGLLLLCPSYAFLGALAVAAVDILPAIGAGIVLIPWGIAYLISGEAVIGVGMLALYVGITVARQIAEPKFVGEAVGIHPLASVMAMFIGYRLFGLVGMITAPMAVVCLKGIRKKLS